MLATRSKQHNALAVFSAGAGIGTLGGLIGLGGAEFRLPLLIGLFGFGALEAVILNKALSLVVVSTALPFRAAVVPFSQLVAHWDVIITLLSGSIVGAWCGAGWATRIQSTTLYNRSSPQPRSVRSQLRNCLYCTSRSDWSFFFVDTRVPEREKTLGSVMSALCSKRAMASRGVGMQ